jgi:DNA ligase-1
MPSVPLSKLVDASIAVASTRSRKRKTALLAELLGELDEHELKVAASYLSGQLPQGRIGVGYATVHTHFAPDAPHGPGLTLRDLDMRISAIAGTTGKGSQAARAEQLAALSGAATRAERAFLVRLLTGELRQGALQGVMADAIANACSLDGELVRRAAMLSGDLPAVAVLARRGDARALAAVRMNVLTGLQPMLAATGVDLADVYGRIARPAFESKLDGARVQIHRLDDRVRIFSRQLNDVTPALPEIVEIINDLPVDSIVLEGEAIALREDGRPLPFQETMKRFGRRQDVARLRRQLPMSLRAFDCLHVDGVDLIDRPLRQRIEVLDERVPRSCQVQRLLDAPEATARAFIAKVLEQGHEGVMAKDLDAPYAAGRRGAAWLKLKPTHTADLVVVGCEWGSGRRRGMLSNLRLAARDGSGGFALVGKTFKGLTDEVLRWQTEHFTALAVQEDRLGLVLEPRVVYEIAFDGVQRSRQYPGGVALRFARYRRRRDDKHPAEATSLQELRALLPAG